MTGGIFGGGVIFVVAAVLWTAVLVPSWVRRREFRAAERHALRLQRTLRVLAEAAEVPTELRVEATAREALAQEKILRSAQRQREAERSAVVAAAEAEQLRAEIHAEQMKRKQATMTRAQKLRRPLMRRVRASGALVALLSALGTLIGVGVVIAGQGVAMLLISLVLFAAALGLLVLLAPGRVKSTAQVAVPPVLEEMLAEETVIAPVEAEIAVPSAVEQAAAHARAQEVARVRSERARAMALARARAVAETVRANQPESILLEEVVQSSPPADTVTGEGRAPEVAPGVDAAAERRAEAAPAPAEKDQTFAQMGVVGDTSTGMLDLDAVLRSRRRVS